jgi:hypothetical protein
MDNLTLRLKIRNRLNKLDSNDYDNIDPWKIAEAFNKAVPVWCRRQLHGTNLKKVGDEQSKRRIDDLQVLLVTVPHAVVQKEGFYESQEWPTNYFEFKRVGAKATRGCCEGRKMVIYLSEEENVDTIGRDHNKKPNFEWGESYVTIHGNKLHIHTNDEFEIHDVTFTYYKQPRRVEFTGVANPYTGVISPADVECEFKDDIVELLIDEAVKILAGDTENGQAGQTADNSVETNN